MKILQFGDLHLEKGTLQYVKPALDRIVEIAECERPELAVFTGDAVTKRGHFFPESAFEFRQACERIAAACELGLVAVDGNHDVLFDGSPSFIVGAMADETKESAGEKIKIATGFPRIFIFSKVIVVAVPTFDRYTLRKSAEQYPEDTPEGIVGAAVRGVVAEARALRSGMSENGDRRHLIAIYHGSISGAKLGNEQIIRSGIDVPVEGSAFAGVDRVLLGHIHRPQIWQPSESSPLFVYNGAAAPLSWSEKQIQPSVPMHSLGSHGDLAVDFFRLPVISQMIEREISNEDLFGSELPIAERIVRVAGRDGEIFPGSRLRLKISASVEVLDLIDGAVEGAITKELELDSLTVVRNPLDKRVAATIGADLGIVDAVSLWNSRRSSADWQADEGALTELALKIEDEIVDERLDARYSFEPLLLKVKNFCQYGLAAVSFEELDGVTMIRGQNTAGKSNLARAIPFALYKIQKSGDVLSDLIRHGEDSAEVELLFRSHGQEFRIKRILKRGKSRSASAVLFFDVLDENSGHWIPAVEGTEQETQAKIAELVGPSDLFFASSYADQNAIDGLLDLRPAEMKDLFATVLHRNFEGRVEKAKKGRKTAEARMNEISVVDKRIEQELVSLSSEAAELETAEQARRRLADALRETEETGTTLRQALKDLDEELARLREDVIRRDGLNKKLDELTKEKSRIEGELAKINTLRTELKGAEASEELLHKNEARLAEFEDQLNERSRRKDEVEEKRGQIRAHYAELRRQATAELGDVQREHDRAERDIGTIEEKLAASKKAAELLAMVPCEGRDWTINRVDEGLAIMRGSQCPLIAEARNEGSSAQIESRSEALTTLRSIHDRAGEKVAAQKEKLAGMDAAEVSATKEFDGWGADLPELDLGERGRLQRAITEQAKRAGKLPLLREAVGREPELTGARAEVEQERERLAGEINGLADVVALHEAAGKKKARIEELISESKKAVSRLTDGLTAAVVRVEKAKFAVEKAHELKAERDELGGEYVELEGRVAIASLYERALGRDGVPFLMIEELAVPQIERRVNHYLEPTPFRVRVSTERESVTSGLRQGVYLTFLDGRGVHPASAASGFQRVALGSSLRQALSDLHAMATGTRISFSVQDEGFGAYDGENIRGAMETIRRIATERERFLFISHIEGMESVADHTLTVYPSESGSFVTAEEAGS